MSESMSLQTKSYEWSFVFCDLVTLPPLTIPNHRVIWEVSYVKVVEKSFLWTFVYSKITYY